MESAQDTHRLLGIEPASLFAAGRKGALALLVLGFVSVVLLGKPRLALAAFLVLAIYLVILTRWRLGVFALLAYLPVAGVVTILLSPWEGWRILHPVLSKDWLFVVPTYLGFFAALALGRTLPVRIGPAPTVLLLGWAGLVLLQTANPGVENMQVGLIGVKVWLSYIPLYVVTAALLGSRHDLSRLMRLLVVLALFPCFVGIAEYGLAQVFGYQKVMYAVYGDLAPHVTQGFTNFHVGSGWIARFPSTFTFVTQYYCFALSMLVPCYIVWRSDVSTRWRRLAGWAFVLVALASFLSGARAAFLFTPVLLVLLFLCDRGLAGLARAVPYLVSVVTIALVVLRAEVVRLFHYIFDLSSHYAYDAAYGGLIRAITLAPLGMGTGTNTGPARYGLENPDRLVAIENYYAKVCFELGIPGLIIVLVLFAFLFRQGLLGRRLLDPSLRTAASALLVFFVATFLSGFKGWFIDLDPINVYFWLFAGILARLPNLDAPPAATAPGRPTR